MKLDLYGPIAFQVAQRLKASAVLVVVLDGPKGSSFAYHGPEGSYGRLPDFLVSLAEQLIADSEAGVNVQVEDSPEDPSP